MTADAVMPDAAAALGALADRIRSAHAEVEAGVRTTLEAAIRCGRLLAEAKQKVRHGQWGRWLDENFPGSPRSAQAYTRLARNAHALADFSAGVEAALKLLAKPEPRGEATRRADPKKADHGPKGEGVDLNPGEEADHEPKPTRPRRRPRRRRPRGRSRSGPRRWCGRRSAR